MGEYSAHSEYLTKKELIIHSFSSLGPKVTYQGLDKEEMVTLATMMLTDTMFRPKFRM